jgi:hypothetical protein
MANAAKHDYVVLAHDMDFSAMLAATQGTKPIVVQIRSDNLSPAAIGESLIAALQQMTPELAAGGRTYRLCNASLSVSETIKATPILRQTHDRQFQITGSVLNAVYPLGVASLPPE